MTQQSAKNVGRVTGLARKQADMSHSLIGVDEVGRGSWAGPLLIVAALCTSDLPLGLKDSKLLSKKLREEYFSQIADTCRLGEGWVQPEEIDELGLTKAMQLGVSRALISLAPDFDAEIIMDGDIDYCPVEFTNTRAVINADDTHPIVSAASIYAKVLRDEHMAKIAQFYPEYGFDKHVGYGTKHHREMLAKHGVSLIHRRSFKPIKQFIGSS